jgi:rubrerythrin
MARVVLMARIFHPREKPKPKRVKNPKDKLFCPVCGEVRGASYAKILFALEKTYLEQCGHLYGKPPLEGWALTLARKRGLAWACDVCLELGRAVAAKPWLQMLSMAYPEFAYWDKSLTCQDCGAEFVFSAKEQTFWYEKLQFVRVSVPKQCPTCRRKRRIYKRDFHDLGRALGTLDPKNPVHLVEVADLYVKIELFDKALEFFRRAKNLLKTSPEKRVLEQRIQEIMTATQ